MLLSHKAGTGNTGGKGVQMGKRVGGVGDDEEGGREGDGGWQGEGGGGGEGLQTKEGGGRGGHLGGAWLARAPL